MTPIDAGALWNLEALPDRELERRCQQALFAGARTRWSGSRQALRRSVRRTLRPHRRNRSYLCWVLRRVADRYLPKVLSQRKKLGFEVSAFGRMKIHKNFFKSAFVTDFFKLRSKESDFLFETAEQKLKIKLMMLEVWGRMYFQGEPYSVVQKSLQEHASYTI